MIAEVDNLSLALRIHSMVRFDCLLAASRNLNEGSTVPKRRDMVSLQSITMSIKMCWDCFLRTGRETIYDSDLATGDQCGSAFHRVMVADSA